ncbi:hypothetical protein OUZ56_012147 [Daphnia magna]|uniref:Uncharacterized protein n=1 Tax=Daphnia magna TaxID=35525 RepID=A0ABQ9Z263_9CRUS|nr:hypothetical protein OUZ56_012147 [Daphnia magna]
MLAPVLLIPDRTLQQTTQNDRLLLLNSNISESSALPCCEFRTVAYSRCHKMTCFYCYLHISVVAQRSRVANSGQLIQQMTQKEVLILLVVNICDSSSGTFPKLPLQDSSICCLCLMNNVLDICNTLAEWCCAAN